MSSQNTGGEFARISFTSRETWLNFHNPETDESLYMDVVTSVSVGDSLSTPCSQLRSSYNPPNEKVTVVLLPTTIAHRIGEFCAQQYDPSRYSPIGKEFDCHSALQYWLGETDKVSLGIGIGNFQEIAPESSDALLGSVATGYTIRSHYPPYLKHSYLGLGADVSKAHSGDGDRTLSVKDINGELLLTPSMTLLHAYGGGIVKYLER